jgi:c-di-GMP-binding flagellar brake protein YcgR
MTQNTRRHRRFKLDLMEVNGKMMLAQKVEIIDIGLGGIALRTDRKLNVGKEYFITLDNMGKHIDVKGIIVRCELVKIEERHDGERIATYTAGMMFKNVPLDKITDFINSIEKHKKEEAPVMVDRRLAVRFYITTPWEKTLSFPVEFKVKNISLSGMLIQTEEALGTESMIPMGLSLKADNSVNLIGKVASCRTAGDKEKSYYEIGVEFTNLTDEGRTLLEQFIDYLALLDVNTGEDKVDY